MAQFLSYAGLMVPITLILPLLTVHCSAYACLENVFVKYTFRLRLRKGTYKFLKAFLYIFHLSEFESSSVTLTRTFLLWDFRRMPTRIPTSLSAGRSIRIFTFVKETMRVSVVVKMFARKRKWAIGINYFIRNPEWHMFKVEVEYI